MTFDEKYLKNIPLLLTFSESFCGHQPDYHTNNLAVRFWDLLWFGKMRACGDTMPQWLCSLSGRTYMLLAQCFSNLNYDKKADIIFKNNLAPFDNDGMAHAGYLVPYKVIQYNVKDFNLMENKTVYGKIYDQWANDQDWALYYAYLFEREKEQ